MSSVDVINAEGAKAGSVELPDAIFDVQANIPLMHQVVVAQLAAARQGTAKVKTRGEVAGGGRKPYKQKGTGRARQGSIRAPQFAGGGVVHGPVPRDLVSWVPWRAAACWATTTWWINGMLTWTSKISAGKSMSKDLADSVMTR